MRETVFFRLADDDFRTREFLFKGIVVEIATMAPQLRSRNNKARETVIAKNHLQNQQVDTDSIKKATKTNSKTQNKSTEDRFRHKANANDGKQTYREEQKHTQNLRIVLKRLSDEELERHGVRVGHNEYLYSIYYTGFHHVCF